MDKRIETFIEKQKNLTLCTCENNVPYCANCFYAFMSDEKMLIFKSGSATKHISQALKNNTVAGTILPDLDKTGTIKGIQFSGNFSAPANNLLDKARKAYYKKFPFAIAIAGEIWVIELVTIKMTDNTLGIGKKLTWERTLSVY